MVKAKLAVIHTLWQGDNFPKNLKFGELVQWVELVSAHTMFIFQIPGGCFFVKGPWEKGLLKANNKKLWGRFNQEWTYWLQWLDCPRSFGCDSLVPQCRLMVQE